jgi:diguanylate cyclase (GGDEF)-like protein
VHTSSQDEDRLAELERLSTALSAAGDVVYEWNLAADTIAWLGDVAGLFAAAPAAMPAKGADLAAIVHPDDALTRQQALEDHIKRGSVYDVEYRVRAADGTYHWVHDRGAVNSARTGAALRLSGSLRSVTGRKEKEAELEYLANFDELTGHYNKVRLRDTLDKAVAEAVRTGDGGAFLVFGIDQLAMINSAYGYQAGDAVLCEIGHRLDDCLRASDTIGRIAGDRFGAVLARIDRNTAMRAAERVVHEIRRKPVHTLAGPVRVTGSAGVCLIPQQATSALDAMAKAEGALRQAKLQGRNRSGLYEVSEAQRRTYRASMGIGDEVQQALKDGRLGFAYQPVVAAGDHAPRFHECLLRLHRPDGEVVPAGKFVPVIEQLGMMRALDRRVLDLAVEDLKRYPDATLAINISGLTATERSWQRALIAKLKERPDLAARLIVEITETAALQDIDETARFVTAARDLGCRVALDDFGAGYTTFRHLKALTVDIVKIDGSFVRNIAEDEHNRLFVRNLIALAQSLDLTTVAECVETAEEAAVLAEEGAALLQGYLFGRPGLEAPWPEAAPDKVVQLADWDRPVGRNCAG